MSTLPYPFSLYFFILPPFSCFFYNTYKFPTHKKESCLQDSPPAVGRFSDIIPLHRSAILPEGLCYVIGTLSYNITNTGSGLFGSIRYLFISQLKPHQDYFTVIFRALYTPFCAYTHIVQVPLPVALIRPSGVTVATFVLLLS